MWLQKGGMGGNFTEYLQANLVSTEKLLVAAKQTKVKRFIYTRHAVWFSKHPICSGTESAALLHRKTFSPMPPPKLWRKKLCSLQITNQVCERSPYGPIWSGEQAIHIYCPGWWLVIRQENLKLWGMEKTGVDLTHVDNVVHAHLCAFESMKVNASLGGKSLFHWAE